MRYIITTTRSILFTILLTFHLTNSITTLALPKADGHPPSTTSTAPKTLETSKSPLLNTTIPTPKTTTVYTLVPPPPGPYTPCLTLLNPSLNPSPGSTIAQNITSTCHLKPLPHGSTIVSKTSATTSISNWLSAPPNITSLLGPHHISTELICETSSGSPLASDLRTLLSALPPHPSTCPPFSWTQNTCTALDETATARTSMCGPTPQYREQTPYATQFGTQFGGVKAFLDKTRLCTYTSAVYPALLLRHCAKKVVGKGGEVEERVGGIARVGVWREGKQYWGFDVSVVHSGAVEKKKEK